MVANRRDKPTPQGGAAEGLRPELASTKQRLGTDLDVIATIETHAASEGEGFVCEEPSLRGSAGPGVRILPPRFASAEGKNGGQSNTAQFVWCAGLVEDAGAYKGRIYDPAAARRACSCKSEKFVESHGGPAGRHFPLRPEKQRPPPAGCSDEPGPARIRGRLPAEHATAFRRDIHPICGRIT